MEALVSNTGLLACAIVLARVCDVSLGTVRSIVVFRGCRVLAGGLGFLETLIWLAAAAQVFQNLDRWPLAIAYAGGFGLGNVVGVWLESKLAVGYELAGIVSRSRDVSLREVLREQRYDTIELRGRNGDAANVEVLLAVESRRRMPRLLKAVHDADPQALWTLSNVRRKPDDIPAWIHRMASKERWLSAIRK